MTAVIANEYGFDETCYIRICLDTINLISVGILINNQIHCRLNTAGHPDIPGDSWEEVCHAQLEKEGYELEDKTGHKFSQQYKGDI